MATKADTGQFQALEQRLNTAEGRINAFQSPASTGYAKAETYTKAEVDIAVKTAIDALKSNQSWITASTTTPQSPYGTPNPVTPVAGGTVTMVTNPAQIPQIFSGTGSISATGLPLPASPYSIQPTGYVQPYTMRIVNNSTVTQYVKPIISLSMATTGGFYYGGVYPQLLYFNVSISSGYGMIQAAATSALLAGQTACVAPSGPPSSGYCPTTTNNGWYVSSQTPPAPAAFPINLSPTTANTQPISSFSFTPTSGLNGYGEFMMTPGQTIDVQISLQVATLQQTNLQITNTISARQ
jgi:hypothetical protein